MFTVDGKRPCVTSVAGSDAPELCREGSGTGSKKDIFSFPVKALQTDCKVGFPFSLWGMEINFLKKH